MKKGPKKTVSIVMPLELYETLKELAKEDVRSIPGYVRLVLQKHIAQRTSAPPQE